GDERMRKAIDESDGVGYEELAMIRQANLADERIEGDEQGIGRLCIRSRQHVEQRRLAGVGVPHERDGRHGTLVSPLTELRAPLTHPIDVVADRVNSGAD